MQKKLSLPKNPYYKESDREKLIGRWKLIASAVFKAENNIIDKWKLRLEKAKKENAAEVADAYLEAIAKEIIDNSQMKFEDESEI